MTMTNPGELTLVEDSIESLRAVANDPALFGVRLCFAEWGYSTPEQQRFASSMPRVTSLADCNELIALFGGDQSGSRGGRTGSIRMAAPLPSTSHIRQSPSAASPRI